MQDDDETKLLLTRKHVKKILKKLNTIEFYKFSVNEEDTVSINKENIPINILRIVAILILSTDGFYKNDELSLSRISKFSLNSIVSNFDIILEQISLKVIDKLEIDPLRFKFSNIQDISKKISKNLHDKIMTCIDSKPEKDIFSDLFSFLFEESETCGKFETLLRDSLIEIGLKKGDSIGEEYFITEKIKEDRYICYKNVGTSKRLFFCKLIDPLEYFPELKELKTNDPTKVYKKLMKLIDVSSVLKREKFESKNIQITNRLEFNRISYCIIPINAIGYSSKCEKIYEIRRYCQYTVETYISDNNKYFIKEFRDFLKTIHSQGVIIGNLCPSKILYEPAGKLNKFFIYDISKMGVVLHKKNKALNNGYDSLSLLKNKKKLTTFYDDAESFMYICNYILTRIKLKYETKEDEIVSKNSRNLDNVMDSVKNTIVKLRELEQNDEYVSDVSNLEKLDNIILYGELCYNETDNNIFKAIRKFIKTISSKTVENIKLTPLQEALYKTQFDILSMNEDYSDLDSSELSQLALKETFKIIYGCDYCEDN